MDFKLVVFLILLFTCANCDDVFEEQTQSKDRSGQRIKSFSGDTSNKSKVSNILQLLNNTKLSKDAFQDVRDILRRSKPKTEQWDPKDEPAGGNIDDEYNNNMWGHPLPDQMSEVQVTTPAYSDDYYESSVYCDFEHVDMPIVRGSLNKPCIWKWNSTITKFGNGFTVTTAEELAAMNKTKDYVLVGPEEDADGNVKGHFLYLAMDTTTESMVFYSPKFPTLWEFCKLELMIHTSGMMRGRFKIIGVSDTYTFIAQEFTSNYDGRWQPHIFPITKKHRNLQIVIEVDPPDNIFMTEPLPHVAIDNIKMVDCFPVRPINGAGHCQPGHVKCKLHGTDGCIKYQQICDLVIDCDDGADEKANCDKIPYGGYCNYELDDCGFKNKPGNILKWVRHNGPTPTKDTGPNHDHTCGPPQVDNVFTTIPTMPANRSIITCVGWYMFVNMNVTGPNQQRPGFASTAVMNSVVFNPPPAVHGDPSSRYYNCCMIRFYYQQYGKNAGSLDLAVVAMTNIGNVSTNLWFTTKDKGDFWLRATVFLPNITTRYFFEFKSRRGIRIYSDSAIDDFSMSPECFGLNMPLSELGSYNYYDPNLDEVGQLPHKAFENEIAYEFTSCNNSGRTGPTQEMCDNAYNPNVTIVTVLNEMPFKGVQTWEVPQDGHYTLIARGASGGLGSAWSGLTQGAKITALFKLNKGEILHIMIGQQGTRACRKSLSEEVKSENANCSSARNASLYDSLGRTRVILNTELKDGGGGGGGATYIFLVNKDGRQQPLLIAAGGGGISIGAYKSDNETQHGRGFTDKGPRDGLIHGNPGHMAGSGGGWRRRATLATTQEMLRVSGESLSLGGTGGYACGDGTAHGGYGGGGGACKAGGGGGGWIGGDAENHVNGDGGWSYIDLSRSAHDFTRYSHSQHMGHGNLHIIPAISGCDCDYLCVALNEYRSEAKCFCPPAWRISEDDQMQCSNGSSWWLLEPIALYTASGVVFIGTIIGFIIGLYLYNQIQRHRLATRRKKNLQEHEVQLRRLRNAPSENGLQSFNPYYGSDGAIVNGVDVRGLPQVSRESLSLVKALGQGAFGEVYQGLYKHRATDSIEMAVAVKTLPELSSPQAEADFLMEAAIMAKFNHPNIVHLIGVCFDSHPRFIVLELLAGGDLKNFLRESRPKPERCSTLTMKDLLLCAIDIARGCKYMESKRFIHRDIAARNCLLTTKGPGRVVKIADFGMSRDIYRSDYYRKGGKALLPIKWMPPEAYMDGVFTSKTDVWSFGVLLWEVFSLGVMPYTGCANKEVMDMVENGGRLEAPFGCPPDIYKLMCEAWNPNPEQRPSFIQIFDRLTSMQDDPEFVDQPLPIPKPFLSSDGISTCSTTQNQERSEPPLDDYLEPTSARRSSTFDNLPSSSSRDPLIMAHSESLGPESPQTADSEFQPLVKASREYGNIQPGTTKSPGLNPEKLNDGTASKRNIHNSKSTDRLLSHQKSSYDDGDSLDLNGKPRVWETSFTEMPKALQQNHVGPTVEKLISIDTPQQTPTSSIPPETQLSMKKPLSLDASQLEENLNELKKNRGSVNLINMNVHVPAYINVVTPKYDDCKTIKIDPKNAVINDISSPEKGLKSSQASLINGPLTEVPFVDSEESSSSNKLIDLKKQSSNGHNESEINC